MDEVDIKIKACTDKLNTKIEELSDKIEDLHELLTVQNKINDEQDTIISSLFETILNLEDRVERYALSRMTGKI